MSNRPFIGAIKPHDWHHRGKSEKTPGLLIAGRSGVAAHVTRAEAFELANRIVDAAEALPEQPPSDPQQPKAQQVAAPLYTSRSDTLTAADGTPEPPLPTTIPEPN